MILLQYQNNRFKTLVSNDYDHIIEQVIEYFRDVRIKCSYCPRRFVSSQSLRNHINPILDGVRAYPILDGGGKSPARVNSAI